MKGNLIRRTMLMLLLGAGMSSVAWGQSVINRDGSVNNPERDSQELRAGSARLVQTDWHWWDRDDDNYRHSDRWYREHGYYNNGYGWYNPYYRNNNGWYNGYHGDGDHDRDDRGWWRRHDHDRDDRWRRNDHDRDDRWRHNDHDRDDRHRDRDHDRD